MIKTEETLEDSIESLEAVNLEDNFQNLGIKDSILRVIDNLKLSSPTPIQKKAIPVAISGQDLIGIAQTGTGKTFAYGIPMLQRIGETKGQGLVVAPTRELALQVAESLKKLGNSLGLRTAVLIGGEAIDRQLFQLRKRPHIVVGTPGRLIDHINKRRTFKLDAVNILVLDEADMMLDMGFAPQVKELLKSMPQERQTLLFSATMPEAIVSMAANYMKLPVSIEVAPPGTTAALVDQEIYIIKGEKRLEHLQKLLDTYTGSVLVFVRTKQGVKTVTTKLTTAGYKATEIHSNLSLGRRRTALEAFKSKRVRILIATDVAARGLDINNIELVVNYNLPDSSDDYVHRIGRTARAGKNGKAISFATTSDFREIKKIEMLINKSIKRTEFVKGETGARSEDGRIYSQKKDFRSKFKGRGRDARSERTEKRGNFRGNERKAIDGDKKNSFRKSDNRGNVSVKTSNYKFGDSKSIDGEKKTAFRDRGARSKDGDRRSNFKSRDNKTSFAENRSAFKGSDSKKYQGEKKRTSFKDRDARSQDTEKKSDYRSKGKPGGFGKSRKTDNNRFARGRQKSKKV